MSSVSAASAPLREFVGDLRRLLASSDPERIHRVKDRLARLLETPGWLPESCRAAAPADYARHRLYQDPHSGFCLVTMVWGPGQRTAVHDHAGVWCVEGVYEGVLEVTRYDLQGEMGETVRFRPGEVIRSGVGACGALIPPSEYHQIRNDTAKQAISLHVYQEDLKVCHVFEPIRDDLYRRKAKTMRYDSVLSMDL